MQIIDILDRLYCSQKYYKDGKLKRGVIHSVLRTLTRRLSNLIIPFVLKISSPKLSSQNTYEDVIVSLTTFPLRAGKLWIVLESLLRQTIKPSRIIVWLSKDQFPTEKDIPLSLLRYRDKGIDIELVENDFRSHKKYHYVVNNYPDAVLVTVDDDIMYPSTMLENLLKAHQQWPNAVIARYAYKMLFDEDGNITSYSKWKRIMTPLSPANDVFFGSGGGTLFPVGAFYKDVKDIDLARCLCPTADDIFLNAQCRINNTPVAVIDSKVALLNVQYKENRRLATMNIDEGNANDIQISAINNYYNKKIF